MNTNTIVVLAVVPVLALVLILILVLVVRGGVAVGGSSSRFALSNLRAVTVCLHIAASLVAAGVLLLVGISLVAVAGLSLAWRWQ